MVAELPPAMVSVDGLTANDTPLASVSATANENVSVAPRLVTVTVKDRVWRDPEVHVCRALAAEPGHDVGVVGGAEEVLLGSADGRREAIASDQRGPFGKRDHVRWNGRLIGSAILAHRGRGPADVVDDQDGERAGVLSVPALGRARAGRSRDERGLAVQGGSGERMAREAERGSAGR